MVPSATWSLDACSALPVEFVLTQLGLFPRPLATHSLMSLFCVLDLMRQRIDVGILQVTDHLYPIRTTGNWGRAFPGGLRSSEPTDPGRGPGVLRSLTPCTPLSCGRCWCLVCYTGIRSSLPELLNTEFTWSSLLVSLSLQKFFV